MPKNARPGGSGIKQTQSSAGLSSPVGKQPARSRRSSAAQFALNPPTAFLVFAACHTLAAARAPIQDCDEVFNYWEPTHYLTDGNGFQTWEYAPTYAIRSWTYVGLHALPVTLIRSIWPTLPKPLLFYGLRFLLGLACAATETKLFTVIGKTLNERVAMLFLIIMTTSPGTYHASIAYLPSSFAMYTSMLGASFFMDWRNQYGSVAGILSFGVGAILGWPFAAALILPFLAEELVLALQHGRDVQGATLKRWITGVALCLIVLAFQTAIDSALYRKLVVVPLNIVLYNVFSSKGPDLYGTEPWHFYIRNLALNFHVWFFLALTALPLWLLQPLLDPARRDRSSRPLFMLGPMYLWLAIFTLQPHKEERFMYPAYPFIALNAALALHLLLAFIGDSRPRSLMSRIPVAIRLSAILFFVAAALVVSALRIAGTWSAFGAPLAVYQPLSSLKDHSVVCLGKEWYRFPSHYLLPHGVEARFVRSEFRGLLPDQFTPAHSAYPFSATWNEPHGMNDDNLEDLGKYTDISKCDYIVDSHLPSTVTTSFEPDFIHDTVHWQVVHCEPFLDSASTGILGRMLWLPDSALLPASLRRTWGEYCLLKRTLSTRSSSSSTMHSADI